MTTTLEKPDEPTLLEEQLALPLSGFETEKLADCERAITEGMQVFLRVGIALAEIRDGKLYRADYPTFEAYLGARWNSLSVSYAGRLISAVEVVGNLENAYAERIQSGETVPIGKGGAPILPTTESQARPLASLPDDQKSEAWDRAVELAEGMQPTAKLVQEAVDELLPPKAEAQPDTQMSILDVPGVAPLSAQGDMTDAEWEASVRPQGETSAQGEADESLQHRPVATPEDAPGTETDSRDEPQAAANTEETDVTHEPAQAVDGNGSTASSAPSQLPEDVPAPPAPKTSAPVPPVAKAPAAQAPTAPKAETPPVPPVAAALPALPAGLMRAVVNREAYESLDAQGLWPLEYAVEEIAVLRTKASMPMHPESIKAGELLEMHLQGAEVLTPPETEILHQLYPDRNIVTWIMLASAFLVRRAQSLDLMSGASLMAPESAQPDSGNEPDPLDSAIDITPPADKGADTQATDIQEELQ